ncbi:MAG: TonB-dependent receptor [Bacteroidetes bacterium]|nr:TonB-dependent receptor [Bacteroidota bacterium]
MFWLLLGAGHLAVGPAHAQDVTGRVLDAETRDPLPGATVVLLRDGAQQGGQITDLQGRYRFSDLAPGIWVLEASFVGYEAVRDTVSLPCAGALDFLLPPQRALMEELIVESQRGDTERFRAGLETIRPEDLKRVPTPGATYDLAGYLLTLPGVVTTGDRGGQLFVRGGTPTQNLILLDGMRIFQPFHVVGFFSAFPADIVSSADVYAGGFNARYGGRISSVIDIRTRNGNKERVAGSASLSPFLSGMLLELPVKKGEASLLFSARESLIDRVAPDLLGQELPFRFGDRFAKFHAFLNQTSSLTLTALRSSDTGNLRSGDEGDPDAGIRRSTWNNEAYGVRYTYIPPEAAVMTEFSVYYSSLDSRYRQTEQDVRSADVSELSLNIGFTYLLGPNQINFGIHGTTHFFDFDSGLGRSQVSTGVSSGGAFFEGRYELNQRVQVEPGVRIEAFSRGLRRTVAPRLRLTLLPSGAGSRHRLSLAWGRYHQQIVGLNNEQDVSDVFTVWTASPRGTPVPMARHYIAGWHVRPVRGVELTVEGYRKDLSDLSFPVFSDEVGLTAEFSQVNGRAEGVDLKAEISRQRLYLSASYGYAIVEYHRPAQRSRAIFIAGTGHSVLLPDLSFNPPHDRRHQVGALARLAFGRWTLGAQWQFGSGLPFTQVNGYYTSIEIDGPDDTGYLEDTGQTFVSRAGAYGGRMPIYHRLDLTLERTFLLRHADLTFQAGAINAYDRANIFEYNVFTGNRVDQLPIIPSVGLRVDMR